MNLTDYLNGISQFDLLTKEDEQRLFKLVQDGDEVARQHVIVSNLRLVVNIAKKYLHTRVPLQDLIQEGNIGLIKSVDKFDPEFDRRFSTYATFWIKQSILRFLNDSKNVVRYPSYVTDLINKINKFSKQYKEENNATPTIAEIAEALEIKPKDIRKSMDLMNTAYVSLEEQVDKGVSLGEKLLTTEEQMCEDFKNSSIINLVKRLKGKEHEIIVHRYGLFGNEKQTLEEVGEMLNLTRERVRQIQKTVIDKLKDKIKRI